MNEIQEIVDFNRAMGKNRGEPDRVNAQRKLYLDEVAEADEEYYQGNNDALCKELCDVIVTAVGLIDAMGYDPVGALHAVNVSNMSKFCIDSDEVKAAINHFKALGVSTEAVSVDGQLAAIVSTGDQIGLDRKEYPGGKMLKPPHYLPPEILVTND